MGRHRRAFLVTPCLGIRCSASTVIVDFARPILGDGPASIVRAYPWFELLSLRETCELSWKAGDAVLLMSTVMQLALPSLRGRQEIREFVINSIEGLPSDRKQSTSTLRRNWKSNLGAQIHPKRTGFRDQGPPLGASPKSGHWRCHPVNASYLCQFLELAKDYDVTVYWLLRRSLRAPRRS